MLGAGLYQVLRRGVPGIPVAALLSGGIMAGFTVMTGGSVSALRALLMFALWLGAQDFGRKYDGKAPHLVLRGFYCCCVIRRI